MLQKILHQLQGEVCVRVITAYPERVLNLCGAWNIAFWDVRWISPTEFSCRLSRGDWRRLHRAVRHMDCVIQLDSSGGIPFLLGRLRHRQALAVCAAAGALALFFGSFYIFDFTVSGNQNVSTEAILRSLERNGVRMGTFGFSVNAEDLRNHVLLELPELSWITVNVSGCRAHVEVRERVQPPERVSRTTPANLTARRPGLILHVQPLSGTKWVLPGATVEEGQLLISGVEDTETSGARIVTGLGSVTARTWYTLQTRMPLTVAHKVYTGEEHVRYALVFGTHRIKFFTNRSDEGTEYDTIYERNKWSLFGVPLPVTTVKETRRCYQRRETAQEPEQAEAILTEYLHTLVDPYGTVRSTLCTSRTDGDALLVTLRAECEEEIGQTTPVYQETDTA